MGWAAPPKPLTWRQRLRAVTQAAEALLHLHTPDEAAGRQCVVHRDFKPANILLDERLHAMLSDTGFAKASKAGDATQVSTLAGDVYTRGFADPLILNTGEYSVVTDGYAVGATLLVVLTNRSAQVRLERLPRTPAAVARQHRGPHAPSALRSG